MFKKVMAAVVLSLCFSTSYAIQVNVQTSSSDVYAVGFKVNGSEHGGAGNSYTESGLPSGASYIFGMRIGGLIIGAEDISCTTVNGGYTTITLNSDTNAVLMYDGNKKCYVEVYAA